MNRSKKRDSHARSRIVSRNCARAFVFFLFRSILAKVFLHLSVVLLLYVLFGDGDCGKEKLTTVVEDI